MIELIIVLLIVIGNFAYLHLLSRDCNWLEDELERLSGEILDLKQDNAKLIKENMDLKKKILDRFKMDENGE